MIEEKYIFEKERCDNITDFKIQITDYRCELTFFKNFELENKDITCDFILTLPKELMNLDMIMNKYLPGYHNLQPIILDLERISVDSESGYIIKSNSRRKLSYFNNYIDPIYPNLNISIENFPILDRKIINNYFQDIKKMINDKKILRYYLHQNIINISVEWPVPFYIEFFVADWEEIELVVKFFNSTFIYHVNFLEMEVDSTITFLISYLYHHRILNKFLAELQRKSLKAIF